MPQESKTPAAENAPGIHVRAGRMPDTAAPTKRMQPSEEILTPSFNIFSFLTKSFSIATLSVRVVVSSTFVLLTCSILSTKESFSFASLIIDESKDISSLNLRGKAGLTAMNAANAAPIIPAEPTDEIVLEVTPDPTEIELTEAIDDIEVELNEIKVLSIEVSLAYSLVLVETMLCIIYFAPFYQLQLKAFHVYFSNHLMKRL